MNTVSRTRIALIAAGLIAGCVAIAFAEERPAEKVDPDHAAKMARGLEIFKKHIRPVLVATCLKCHGDKKTEAGLDLSDRATLLKGGDSGPTILPERARDSLLIKLLRHEKEPRMPKEAARLPEETVKQFIAWIDNGAPYDKPLIEKADPRAWVNKKIDPSAKQHWAYQPLRRVDPPAVNDAAWCRTP